MARERPGGPSDPRGSGTHGFNEARALWPGRAGSAAPVPARAGRGFNEARALWPGREPGVDIGPAIGLRASMRPGRFGPGEGWVRKALIARTESARIRAGLESTAISRLEGAVDGAELSNIRFPINRLRPVRAGPGKDAVLNRSQAGGASVFSLCPAPTTATRRAQATGRPDGRVVIGRYPSDNPIASAWADSRDRVTALNRLGVGRQSGPGRGGRPPWPRGRDGARPAVRSR